MKRAKERWAVSATGGGSVLSWRPRGFPESLIFPPQDVMVGDGARNRGGGFPCCPIFGPMPNSRPYAGISLPKHGLIRQHPFAKRPKRLRRGQMKSVMWFYEPWDHSVGVRIAVSNNGYFLKHEITVRNNGRSPMPISLGFHPYFSTDGRPFEIRHGNRSVKSESIQRDEPLFIRLKGAKLVSLFANGALITFTLTGYTDLCIWTDNPEKYICVEPVMKASHDGDLILMGRQSRTVSCALRVEKLRR